MCFEFVQMGYFTALGCLSGLFHFWAPLWHYLAWRVFQGAANWSFSFVCFPSKLTLVIVRESRWCPQAFLFRVIVSRLHTHSSPCWTCERLFTLIRLVSGTGCFLLAFNKFHDLFWILCSTFAGDNHLRKSKRLPFHAPRPAWSRLCFLWRYTHEWAKGNPNSPSNLENL